VSYEQSRDGKREFCELLVFRIVHNLKHAGGSVPGAHGWGSKMLRPLNVIYGADMHAIAHRGPWILSGDGILNYGHGFSTQRARGGIIDTCYLRGTSATGLAVVLEVVICLLHDIVNRL
jgi:hypothetical protein